MRTSTSKNEILLNAYSTDNFKKEAQKIIDIIANELENVQANGPQKTINRKSPEEQLAYWSEEFASTDSSSLPQLSKKIM